MACYYLDMENSTINPSEVLVNQNPQQSPIVEQAQSVQQQPSIQPTQTPSPTANQNIWKIATGVLGLLLIVGGLTFTFIEMKKPATQNVSVAPSPSPTVQPTAVNSSPITTSTLSTSVTTAFNPNFSGFLKTNCVPDSAQNGLSLSLSKIPLDLSSFKTELSSAKNSLYCGGVPDPVENSFFTLADGATGRLTLYGPKSQELGHGGANFVGQFGELLRQNNDLTTSVYIDPPDACGIGLDSIVVRARVIKTMKATDGSDVFLSDDQAISTVTDQRLIDLFKPYVKTENSMCGAIIGLDPQQMDKMAVDFVKKLPETDAMKVAIKQLETKLSLVKPVSITSKDQTQTSSTDWKTAKFGDLLSYDYPANWHVAVLWPNGNLADQGISIVMDPNPIDTSPRDGSIATFTIDVRNGLANPDQAFTDSKAQFNSDRYKDIQTETLQSSLGPIYYYKGKMVGPMYAEEIVERYYLTFNQNKNDPANQAIVTAELDKNSDPKLSEMLRHIVMSFKKP